MALVWVEPFDIYGTNTGLVVSRGYTANGIAAFDGGGKQRTGTVCGTFNNARLIRAFDTAQTTMGQGVALSVVTLTAASANTIGGGFQSAGGTREVSWCPDVDASICVYDRTGTLVGRTAPNAITVLSYSWIEFKATGNVGGVANTGTVELRINGVTPAALTINGINLPNAFAFGYLGGTTGGQNRYDDWIIWDNTGTKNNDFMGDRRLFTSFPSANLALQDFTPSAGSAFSCVKNNPPVDTTYIDGAAAGNVSEFSKDALGILSTDIAAAVVIGRLFKSDAGTASARLGVNSNGFVSNSAEQFPGTSGSWFNFIQELDPNGNIAWTRAAYDLSAIRITRQQ